MIFGWPLSGLFEAVGTFLGGERLERLADGQVDALGGPPGGMSQQMLELGEELPDGVQVGRVSRQEELATSQADQEFRRYKELRRSQTRNRITFSEIIGDNDLLERVLTRITKEAGVPIGQWHEFPEVHLTPAVAMHMQGWGEERWTPSIFHRADFTKGARVWTMNSHDVDRLLRSEDEGPEQQSSNVLQTEVGIPTSRKSEFSICSAPIRSRFS